MAFKMKAGKEGPMKKNFPSVFKKETKYHSEVKHTKKMKPIWKRQEEVDKAFSSNYQKDPAVKRDQRLKEIELMRKNLKKSGEEKVEAAKKSPNKFLGGLIAKGVGKLAAKGVGKLAGKALGGGGKGGAGDTLGAVGSMIGGPLGGLAGRAVGGLLGRRKRRGAALTKKTKAEKDHNKAARKTEGSKLRQALRRKLGKNRPKKS